jgi:predicted RNase H-like HicB family nuclease
MAEFIYRVEIEPLPLEEGGGFVARVPDLPGCMSDGETPQEALANVLSAMDDWMDEAVRLGQHVPEPTRLRELA